LNLSTHQAVRIATLTRPGAGEGSDDLEAWKALPEEDLFHIQEVTVALEASDMPGKPVRSVLCARCHEAVLDRRDVAVDGQCLCRPCADGHRYYGPVAGAVLA
jgi:formylmethanofuran dehydrogenase subunit E